jgi:hypothetical protein
MVGGVVPEVEVAVGLFWLDAPYVVQGEEVAVGLFWLEAPCVVQAEEEEEAMEPLVWKSL